ncbi:MAG: Holliday junction resolvase-like protein [Candidatus Nanoarchaeia archaeon]|nr:Holliday junction resolvase-like protein [Candidatus Nanoarchaeia archaeon]
MAEILTIILLVGVAILFLAIGYIIGKKITEHIWKDKLPEIREEAIQRSRAVLAGQFSEQLAPYLPDFPFKPTEARFIGKPIDFLVFKGMDEKNIDEVVFVEVKSGKANLNSQERNLKDVIKDKRVHWYEYRIPEDLTKKRE